ncbi:MAG TPA: alpha-amylase family glycosyl hydrolase, partial [Saprospiraceae bacterium]|nr:alpha-amylase family glycosyl hydrolase [Saprospiraceae bacterium]
MEQDILTNNHLELGASPNENGVYFRVWAPHADNVSVVGNFNDWNVDANEMVTEDGEFWSIQIENLKAGDEYKYAIKTKSGDILHRNDPRAKLLTNSSGNSIVYQDNFDWEDDHFQLPPMNELIIYEMHIGTFHAKTNGQPGDFHTAIEKIDHLVNIGINCVEIMPVNEFAGDFSWGYNPAHPFAIESAYGGPDAFKAFVKACHQKGIGVILDVVYNHFGPSDMDLWQFDGWSENGKGGIYFYNNWKSTTPWGDSRPDYGRNAVRSYIHDNAMMWLREFRCDGLRMDMVPYIRNVHGNESPDASIEEGFTLLRWINDSIHEEFPNKITIAEDLHGNDFITRNTSEGGCGFSAQWDADYVHPVRQMLIAGNDDDMNFENIFTALTRRYSNDTYKRIIYTESHDEVANGRARITTEVWPDDPQNYYAVNKAALGLCLTLTAPGIPMLFQGQEMLEDNWFDDQDPIDWKLSKLNAGFGNMTRQLTDFRANRYGNTKGLTGSNIQILHSNMADKVIAFQRVYEDMDKDSV